MTMTVEMRPVASIKVTDRIRDTFGDVRELADSLRERGLINPVTIQADGMLIAGERRWRAARELGWTEIACHIWDEKLALDELLAVEIEENTCRLELTLPEKERAYERHRKLEEARLRAQGKDQSHPPESGERWRGPVMEAADKVAKALGTNRQTMAEVREIRETAEDEGQPESVREVAEQEYGKLTKATRGAAPALERVRLAKRQATRDVMVPGQWLKGDEPQAGPKTVTWHTRLWDVVGTGRAIRKTAEELELDPDTSSLSSEDIKKMSELLQEQISDRQYLRKVLLNIGKGRK